MNKEIVKTFKRGSKTFFNSTLFFPKQIREDVFKFYAFVRAGDDLVDSIPQRPDEFFRFKEKYYQAINNKSTRDTIPAKDTIPTEDNSLSRDTIIDSFVELSLRLNFSEEWTSAYFHSMEMDLYNKRYNTIEELMTYTYGTAEVIGLFMAKILGLDSASYTSARLLGRAMQHINFIRDIAEDLSLGRIYLPLEGSGLDNLDMDTAMKYPDIFKNFVYKMLDHYYRWQSEAEAGYKYIPKRYLIPIKTAADMYKWTGEVIKKDPFIVYRRKVKPGRLRVLFGALKNILYLDSR